MRKKFQAKQAFERELAHELKRKTEIFLQHKKTKKQVQWAVISPMGIKPNTWSSKQNFLEF